MVSSYAKFFAFALAFASRRRPLRNRNLPTQSVGPLLTSQECLLASTIRTLAHSLSLPLRSLPLHPITSLPKPQRESSRDTHCSPSPISSGGFQGTTSMLGGSFSPRSCSQALIFFSLSSQALQTPPPKTRVWRRQPSAWITSPVMVTDPVDSVEEVEEVEWVFV